MWRFAPTTWVPRPPVHPARPGGSARSRVSPFNRILRLEVAYARPIPAPTFDLQAHSLHSDGQLPAAEVVARAAAAGVELFSLTDHDTIDGVPEALDAGARAGIRVVVGTELSALRTDREDLHLLG